MTHSQPVLRVKRLHESAVVPQRAHETDAGLDLSSSIDVRLGPGARATVPTGVAIEIPQGWCGLVCPRSGLAARHGVGVVNAPGVIDSGYRGEIKVVLINHDPEHSVELAAGDRIAQLVVTPVMLGALEEVTVLSDAERNDAGFGSTGGANLLTEAVE